MKNKGLIWLIIFFILTGCKQTGIQKNDLITVDVTTSYPRKELILQDFMDVEYIPLETNDEFVTQGLVLAVGKDMVIVKNRTDDGDIFIFDRKGKALRKINRKGQSGEEYTFVLGVVLDEDKNEMFVNDIGLKKILVYDMEGNYKRTLPHKDGKMYDQVYNFDRENLICHDGLDDNISSLSIINSGQSFMLVSKQDGSVIKEIQIPFKEKKIIVIKIKDEESKMTYAYMPSTVFPMVPNIDGFALIELSADTIYSYTRDNIIKPMIIRTPSIQSMNPEVFLLVSLLTDRYYFMETIKKEMEFTSNDLLYDKKEKAIYRYTVYNGDYSIKEEAFMKSEPLTEEIPSRQILEAPDLVIAYKKGWLKGELKEIAAELDEESNPVIMLIKHKK